MKRAALEKAIENPDESENEAVRWGMGNKISEMKVNSPKAAEVPEKKVESGFGSFRNTNAVRKVEEIGKTRQTENGGKGFGLRDNAHAKKGIGGFSGFRDGGFRNNNPARK